MKFSSRALRRVRLSLQAGSCLRATPRAGATALVLSALAACGEATAPPGRAVDVTVRAYIDADNSGTYTAGDVGLANTPLTLAGIGDGAATYQATTDASGSASFTGVAPGSYSVAAVTAPAGTVIAGGTEARVTVNYIGAVSASDLRYAYQPGTVSGRIFRDDNNNGTFDATDTPGAGLAVILRRGTTRVDSMATDATGSFRFNYLVPGEYTVVLENPGSISYGASGATRTVTVNAGAQASVNGVFTGSLILDIADARAKATGTLVAVRGRLIARPGSFPSGANSEIWIQDATGGIAVFSLPTADSANYVLGDTLEVTGTTSVFSGQRQIGTPSLNIVKRGRGPEVAPLAQTVVQAKALTNEGRLVTIPNVRVASVPTGTGAAFTVLVNVGNDTLQIRVAGNLTGLSRANFIVGDRYSITGVLTQFNGTAQVKVRSAADVQSAITAIGTLRTRPVGTVATVTGNITVKPGMFTSGTNFVNSEIWLQDATGGIAVFSLPTADSTVYQLGDRIEVTGTLGAFSGQLQLGTPTFTRLSSGTAPAAATQTGTQLNARTLEGQLVTLQSFTVTSVPTGTGAAFTIVGDAADGQRIEVRVAGLSTGLTRGNFVVGQTYSVTGILTQFNGVAQIKVRQRSDVTP